MSAIDTAQKLVDAFGSLFGASDSAAALNVVQGFMKVKYTVSKPTNDQNILLINGATSVNAKAVSYVLTLDHNVENQFAAEQLAVTFDAAVTEANTDFATFALVFNNGNGGSDTTLFTGNTVVAGALVNATANTPKLLTINTSNNPVTRGSCLQLKVTKSGAGLILPGFSVTLTGKRV